MKDIWRTGLIEVMERQIKQKPKVVKYVVSLFLGGMDKAWHCGQSNRLRSVASTWQVQTLTERSNTVHYRS